MKYLYEELERFKTNLSRNFEDDELQEELNEMTENMYFENILEVCQEIVNLKEILIDFGYEL